MSSLFSSFKLRGVELQNRIVVSPMCQYSAIDGVMGDWHLMHLGNLSLSGPGLVFVEATGVEARGRITPSCVGLHNDKQEASQKRIIQFCKEHGTSKMALQLAHAGRKASTLPPWEGGKPLGAEEGAWETIAPSAIPFVDGWHIPREMDEEDLETVRRAFVDSALRAERIGFDVLEIHGAHGYLLSEFLSPIANRRKDCYGGSLENRMRFPLEVFEAVRKVWPSEKPMGVRISATDWDDPGWTLDESVVLAGELKQLGCDFIDCSSGGNSPKRPPVGPGHPGYQVPFAERIRKDTGIPTMAVGMLRDASLAEGIVSQGKADMISLARGMLYDPRWSWHAAEELGAVASYPKQYERSRPAKWPLAFPEINLSTEKSDASKIKN